MGLAKAAERIGRIDIAGSAQAWSLSLETVAPSLNSWPHRAVILYNLIYFALISHCLLSRQVSNI